jgi:RNA polymerase-binding transcription factor
MTTAKKAPAVKAPAKPEAKAPLKNPAKSGARAGAKPTGKLTTKTPAKAASKSAATAAAGGEGKAKAATGGSKAKATPPPAVKARAGEAPVAEAPPTETPKAGTPPAAAAAERARKTPAPAGPRSGHRHKEPVQPKAAPYATDAKFLEEQRALLVSERAIYQEQAEDLKAEADSLAQEREPGDVQFDEESGEGGTVTVDRERDLALSAQALAAVSEIDAALGRIDSGTYGVCERCHQAIPKPRLRALPYARLCVACKSGGLSRR